MKNLDVQDEFYPDCVKINGIVYSKELFRLWGTGGMNIGQLFKVLSRNNGALEIQTIHENIEGAQT